MARLDRPPFRVLIQCPTPLEGDSAELTTALHCVSAQWERGERKAAISGLADAVIIAEEDGHAERATVLARALGALARAARGATISGEREKVQPSAWKPEQPTSELIPIHEESPEPVAQAAPEAISERQEDMITARLAAEVLEEARARMKLKTADAFKVVPLAVAGSKKT